MTLDPRLGWNIPSAALCRENWREMEQTTPFDGVMFKVEAKDDQGATLSSEAIGDGRACKREWLQQALADLKSCRFAPGDLLTPGLLQFGGEGASCREDHPLRHFERMGIPEVPVGLGDKESAVGMPQPPSDHLEIHPGINGIAAKVMSH